MTTMDAPLRFGLFLPPLHKSGINPHLALHRDLEIIERVEEYGFDEVWVGEHHSGGIELIASPEVFIAAASQRTSTIRLGTGVISLPFHHPLMVADRLVLLDHITRGRVMFGAGPGLLASDAAMLGLGAAELRPQMEEQLDTVLRLLRGEAVTKTVGNHVCHEAALQLLPYSDIEVAVTSMMSPNGPKLAGRHGTSLLSLGASSPEGIELLGSHWDVLTTEAARHGHSVDRSRWRLMGMVHVAESVEQAKRNVKHGMRDVLHYASAINPGVGSYELPDDLDSLIDDGNDNGNWVIGTPDMAVAQLQRLQEKSGGFGCFLIQGDDFAPWEERLRSLQLFADEVVPTLNGSLRAPLRSHAKVTTWTEGAESQRLAIEAAIENYEKEKADAG